MFDLMLHNYVVAHKASSLGRSGLSCQASQLVGAFIFFPTSPPAWRRTPNQDRKLIRDNPKIRRSSLTFAAHLSLRNSTQQTQAGLSSVCDITFAAMHSLYTGERMARRKRAGLFPAYVYSPAVHGSARSQRYVRRALPGIIRYSCGVSNHALGWKVGVDSEALPHSPMAARVLPAIGRESLLSGEDCNPSAGRHRVTLRINAAPRTNFCSCGVDSDTQAFTTNAISGQLSTRSKTSCARSSRCNSGHEQSFLRDSTPHASKAASVAPRKSRVNRCCPETDQANGLGEVGARRNSTPVLSLNVRANKASRRLLVSPSAEAAAIV